MSKVTVIVPVVRTQNMPALLEAIKQNHGLPEGDVDILWAEDKERIGCLKMVKALTDLATTDLVCFLGDDTQPQPNFLAIALQILEENDLWMVGFNDEHTRTPSHWLASKKLLNERGEFFDTRYGHNFADSDMRVRAERLGRYAWSPQAVVRHNHPSFGAGAMDEHYEKVLDKERWARDEALFRSECCKLSVAIIAKNEEAMLARCLESVKGADEIVVVDTGSTDMTKEIAKTYTDKVFDFAWCDDFSAARNEALKHCTHDWCLSIDADEVLEPGGIEKLRQHLTTYKDAVGIRMACGVNSYHVPRCFRNTPLIKWVGRIHELPNTTDYDKTDVTITYASSPAHALDPDRNVRILEAEHAERPTDSRILYYLAREYCYRGRYTEAIATFDNYFQLAAWLPEKADAYFMQALAYWHTQEGEKARASCLKALEINANFKVAALLMATMSWEHNQKPWLAMAEAATNENTLNQRVLHLAF
jgi:glycosyltransferase involved in cell wall biosynthesis